MKTYLGVELGSTRIKAIAIDQKYNPVSQGDYTWASSYENGIWTYDLCEAWSGLKKAIGQIENREDILCAGISGMMHGYLAFDNDWNLLTPFRTWQNTITAQAAAELTELFGFNIPQRWSIAHLWQAILNGEEHLPRLAHITTLSGYIHYMLTGVNAVGICEASGIFPIDSDKLCYNEEMVAKFNELLKSKGIYKDILELMPSVLCAGEDAGSLTKEGAALIDDLLPVGTPFAPPEGDGGTGMTATNSVAVGTGNVSAGTSIFSMVVLDKYLENVYEEIDLITTPAGKPVAMVHCNNCTTDTNHWAFLLEEAAALFGATPSKGELFTKLYEKSFEADADCGGIMVCNYLAGEGVTHMDKGRPMVLRTPEAKFTLANFFRASLYSTMATLKLGMEILEKENVEIKSMTGHGGLFKTPVVGQRYMAAAIGAPVTCTETSGEGGAYGIALLAAYRYEGKDMSLGDYLTNKVFADAKSSTLAPDETDIKGFNSYMDNYKRLLRVEEKAIEVI
ncbi:MAG: ATPase [Clostridia bacterium]|nr:ATPase [Clostridia bacterium]